MTPEFTLSLNIAQLIMLGGLIWGLARMSKSVDNLGKVSDSLVVGLERIGAELALIVSRVSYLEGIGGRRMGDRPR